MVKDNSTAHSIKSRKHYYYIILKPFNYIKSCNQYYNNYMTDCYLLIMIMIYDFSL